MIAKEFSEKLFEYLEGLSNGDRFGDWIYKGKTEKYFGSPGGGWKGTDGFLFENENSFIVRSLPSAGEGGLYSYLVVESIDLEGQLSNIQLNKEKTYTDENNITRIIETYSMTAGKGRLKTELVEKKFGELNFKTNIIAEVDDNNPDWSKVISDILQWSIVRKKVKESLIYEQKTKDENVDDKKELIPKVKNGAGKNSHPLNQILYGPPGTGKTFNTINKALEIIGFDAQGKKRDEIKKEFDKYLIKDFNSDDGQIVFTTFHQSMSYEDFIEGIKPLEPKKEGDHIYYKVVSGIFKKLCELAEKKQSHTIVVDGKKIPLTKDLFDEYYFSYADKLPGHNKNSSEFSLKTPEGYDFFLFKNSANSIVVKARSMKTSMSVSCNELQKVLFNGKEPTYKSYENSIIESILEGRNYEENKTNNPKKKFVLIIDEINRGNVSQIFGELITLIEEDKRLGNKEELETILPYSKEKFGVPPNLHIIGTMNTADRSVEALDSALRRRFSFIEISPNYKVIKTEGKLKGGKLQIDNGDIYLADLLELINNRIEKLLDKDHLIGHSYFLSVDSILSLKTAFQDQIIPLLQEYFYGDFGKIGLVLGKDFFVDQGKQNNENIFAGFDESYETEGLQERPVYKLKSPQEMKEGEFEQAILNLIKTNNA